MDYIERGTKEYKHTNRALFAAGFITFANLYITQPLMPVFTKEFGISPATASLSLSVTTLTLAVGLVIVSSLSEAWGRKRLMTLSIFAASLLTVALAFAPNYHVLLGIRAVQGAVFAGLPAIAMAYLGEEMHPKDLGVAMGLYISGNSVGGLAGRVLMGTFADWFGWHTGMLIIGGLSLLISVYFTVSLPESRHFTARELQFGNLWRSLLSHLKDRRMLALFAMGFFLMGSFVTLYNYIGFKLLEPPYSLSTTIVGWIFIVYLVGTVSSTWFGKLANAHGRRMILRAGMLLMLGGALLTLPVSLPLKIVGIVLFTFGFFGSHSIASGWVSHRASHDKAQASSLYLFFYYTGSSVGGTAGGFFWGHFGWIGVIGMIVCFLFAAILLTVAPRSVAGGRAA